MSTGQGAVFANLAGATFTAAAGATMHNNQGGPSARFENAGRVVIRPPDAGGGDTRFLVDYVQSGGETELEDATFVVDRGLQLQGGDLLGNGAFRG